MHPLREVFGGNREAGNVAAWICKLAESIQESQSLKHSRVDTNTYRGIARFNSPYGRATRKCYVGAGRPGYPGRACEGCAERLGRVDVEWPLDDGTLVCH